MPYAKYKPYRIDVSDKFIPVEPVASPNPTTLTDNNDDPQTFDVASSVNQVPYDPSPVASTLTRPFFPPDPPSVSNDTTALPEAPDIPSLPTDKQALNIPSALPDSTAVNASSSSSPASSTPTQTQATKSSIAASTPVRQTTSAQPTFSVRGNVTSPLALYIPHGDELTAKQTADNYLRAGGDATVVSANSTARASHGVNPNAIFKTDNPMRTEVERNLFAAPRDLIVALHNTYGGALNAEQNRSDAMSVKEPKYGGYILTTDPDLYQELLRSPYNVILQAKTTPENDDGSLSRYSAKIGQPYVNVEAVRGDATKQQAMLQTVLAAYQRWKAHKVSTSSLPFASNPILRPDGSIR